jgi:hypothetical protein
MWILGSLKCDLVFLMLPGLFSVGISMLFPHLAESSLVYGLIATGLVDSGHVYTTFWRTLFTSGKKRQWPWMVPVFFILFFGVWYYFSFPGLWTFVVYSTLFHHVRQSYGFSKWYQTLNHRADPISDRFFYGLIILPMVTYHFSPGALGSYYSENDLFLYPLSNVRDALMVIYSVVLFSWICYETKLWKRGLRESNRIISVGYPALIYGYCFLVGETLTQILIPLLFVHGVAYFGVMGQTLHRTQKQRFSSLFEALSLVIITACVFGLSEAWIEEEALNLHSGSPLWLSSLLIGLTLMPLYCHYFYDAIIWKKSHAEADLVYGKKIRPPA